ncbi:hypothetical protein MTO96_052022 [Rhipicephalus appendiculatus]
MYPDFNNRDVNVTRASSTAAPTPSPPPFEATIAIGPIISLCVVIGLLYYCYRRFYERCCWRRVQPVMVVQAPAQPVVNVNVVR